MYKQEIKMSSLSWQTYKNLSMASMPQQVRERLLSPGSLTQYLEKRVEKTFQVEVLSNGWLYPHHDEVKYLDISTREKAWVREVYLRCDGEVAIYAWSVFPESTLTGKYKGLQRLGNKSLGKILFKQSEVLRSEFEIAQITLEHPLYQKVARELSQEQSFLWARRSCFKLEDKPVLVNELFLPYMFNEKTCQLATV